MHPLLVLNVVGLTEYLLAGALPRINRFISQGARARVSPAFPAVTCSAQATHLTGTPSRKNIPKYCHGIDKECPAFADTLPSTNLTSSGEMNV